MNPQPLTDAEVDTLLRRELSAPQPSSAWRDRVLAATVRADLARETVRGLALQELRARCERRLAAERQRLLRRVLPYVLIAACSIAALPALVAHLAPAFGSATHLGLDGLSMTIAMAALCCGLATGFPRQMKALVGL